MFRALPAGPPFRLLHRRLLQRRLARWDLRLRIEIVLLAGIIGMFLFWQARVPLDGLRRASGAGACAATLAGILAVIAVGTGALIGIRHARQLRAERPGPEWLALPLPARQIAEHFAWEARLHSAWGAALAPGFLIAGTGLLPAWALVLLSAAFGFALWGCARLGTALATRSVGGERRGSGGDRLLAVFAEVRSAPARLRIGAARWRRTPAWQALWLKDVVLALRAPRARTRLMMAAGLLLASCAVWLLPPSTDRELFSVAGLRFIAFAAALLSAVVFAEFLIELAGLDPLAVLHALPLAASTVWWSRAASAALFAGALALGQALSARPLAPMAMGVLLVWLLAATLAIHLLGVHYGMTIPRTALALRFLTLSLAIAMSASIMIPLVGWILLLTAVIHSARRVPRWASLEDER